MVGTRGTGPGGATVALQWAYSGLTVALQWISWNFWNFDEFSWIRSARSAPLSIKPVGQSARVSIVQQIRVLSLVLSLKTEENSENTYSMPKTEENVKNTYSP